MNATQAENTPNAVAEQTVKLATVERPLPNLRKASLGDVTIGGKPYSEIVNADKGKGKGKGKGNGKVAKVKGPLAKYERIIRLASEQFAKLDDATMAEGKAPSTQPVEDRLAKSFKVWGLVNGSGDVKLDRRALKEYEQALNSTRGVKLPNGKEAILAIRSIKYAKNDSSGVPTERRYGAVLTEQLTFGERKQWVSERVTALNRWLKAYSKQ